MSSTPMLDDVSGDCGDWKHGTTRIHRKPANSPDKPLALMRQYAAHERTLFSHQVGRTYFHLLLYTLPVT